jgi:hypothetical protein
LCLNSAKAKAEEQLDACGNVIGIGPKGWVPRDQYHEAKQRERKLKVNALDAAESAERRADICENWISSDFDEEDYV